MNTFFFQHRKWLWPLIFLAILTPFTPFLDLYIAHYFFDQDHQFSSNYFYVFIYHYGVLPAQIVFAFSTLIFICSYWIKKWTIWRKPALVLFLSLLLGGGLLVHEVFKNHWGRPRPKQIIEFGGHQSFRPFYKPNLFHQPEPSKSFPCGHCTMGFYFFTLALIAKRYHYFKTFCLILFLALALGISLSLARIAQGGHFFSDTLVSAIIMWISACLCDLWVFRKLRAKGNLNERLN